MSVMRGLPPGGRVNPEKPGGQPAAGIYVGQGASHSWTWFADLFDRLDWCGHIAFLDERDVAAGALDRCGTFFVSGGDTFAIAGALGRTGSQALERFVRGGGRYIGSCAGAYLVLRSSLTPLNMFNFVQARITNLSKNLPQPHQKPEKFCTPYGCRYVFHPVREEVKLRIVGRGLLTDVIRAPLYGGPAMLPSDDIDVLAEYAGFTDKTHYLVDSGIASEILLGNVAVARKKLGRGALYLLGPHFEHPGYPEANRFLYDILLQGRPEPLPDAATGPGDARPADRKLYRAFLSQISNARIVSLALERTAYTWQVGHKTYDPERIRVFIESIWKRSRGLEVSWARARVPASVMRDLIARTRTVTACLRQLRQESASGSGPEKTADRLLQHLRTTTASFLAIYFSLKRNSLAEQGRRSPCTCISKRPRYCTP